MDRSLIAPFLEPWTTASFLVAGERLVYANRRFRELTGQSEDDFRAQGFSLAPLAVPEEREEVEGLFRRALGEVGREARFEFTARTAEGKRRLEATLIGVTLGGEAFTWGILRDVTAMKEAGEALRLSEERYRTILEEMEDGYQEVDLKGNFTFFNESFRRILGYPREELLGSNYSRYAVSEEEAQRVWRAYNEMFRTGRPLRRMEWTVIDRAGRRRVIEFSASLIRDAAGHRRGFRGIVRDVTDRKEVEDQYRLIAGGAQTGIYIVQDGLICFINPHISEYSGYTEEEMLGSRILFYVHPEDRAMVREKAKKMLSGELKTPYEYRIVTKTGEVRWLIEKVTPIPFRGRPAVLGNSMDITQQKEEEKRRKNLENLLVQAQKMEAIGTLAGGVAHDFNNLLMGIQGLVSLMLLRTEPGHPHYNRLKAIEEQVQSGAMLTRQLLGFAQGGRYEVRPTDMNTLIGNLAAVFARTKKEIRLREDYAEDLWSVDVDRGQMEQALLNLLINAWQAMPGGGDLYLKTENIVIDEEIARTKDLLPGPYVRIAVTDTGCGMDEKTKQRVFEPFFTTREMGRGTGLGLSSVYGIVKGHGGVVNVYSELGHGTTFSIYLPASPRDGEAREIPVPGETAGGKETVLVVDDEEVIGDVTAGMLEHLGYRVLTARSGSEALEIFAVNRDRIDVVILDMIMPGMGGGEVFDRMRTMKPEVKVILSSGYSLNGMAKEIMDRGVRAFIQKPFTMDGLSRKIREVLRD